MTDAKFRLINDLVAVAAESVRKNDRWLTPCYQLNLLTQSNTNEKLDKNTGTL